MKNRNQMTERILNLTLEIIYLLTGENYMVVKKPGEHVTYNNNLRVSEGSCRTQISNSEPQPHSLIHERNNEQKILKLTNKIIQLLTGEEWLYLEGHKNGSKDVTMENHQFPYSVDGSVRNYREEFPISIPSLAGGNHDKGISKMNQRGQYMKSSNRSKADGLIQNETTSQVEGNDTSSYTTTDYSPVVIKKESDIYTPPEHTQTQYTSTHIKVESASREGEEKLTDNCTPTEHTQGKYTSTYIKVESASREGEEKLTDNYTSTEHTQGKYTSTHSKVESASHEEGGNLTDIYTPTEHISPFIEKSIRSAEENLPNISMYTPTQSTHVVYKATPIKEESTLWDEESLTYTYIYTPKERAQIAETSRYIKQEPRSCEEETLTYTDMYTPAERIQRECMSIQTTDHFSEDFNTQGMNRSLSMIRGSEYDTNLTASAHSHRGPTTSERMYSCSQCAKCFISNSDLLKHQSVHREKKLSCSDCGKCFTRISHLVVHQRIHTGEKPFPCYDCGKRFSQISHLVIHQRIHTGEKPFSCYKCGKCFTQSSHLVRHQRIHT
ncbi:uncharacterized protein RCH25_008776 [Pelodytes ibericus]